MEHMTRAEQMFANSSAILGFLELGFVLTGQLKALLHTKEKQMMQPQGTCTHKSVACRRADLKECCWRCELVKGMYGRSLHIDLLVSRIRSNQLVQVAALKLVSLLCQQL